MLRVAVYELHGPLFDFMHGKPSSTVRHSNHNSVYLAVDEFGISGAITQFRRWMWAMRAVLLGSIECSTSSNQLFRPLERLVEGETTNYGGAYG
jgi:hypothetical protein